MHAAKAVDCYSSFAQRKWTITVHFLCVILWAQAIEGEL